MKEFVNTKLIFEEEKKDDKNHEKFSRMQRVDIISL